MHTIVGNAGGSERDNANIANNITVEREVADSQSRIEVQSSRTSKLDIGDD